MLRLCYKTGQFLLELPRVTIGNSACSSPQKTVALVARCMLPGATPNLAIGVSLVANVSALADRRGPYRRLYNRHSWREKG